MYGRRVYLGEWSEVGPVQGCTALTPNANAARTLGVGPRSIETLARQILGDERIARPFTVQHLLSKAVEEAFGEESGEPALHRLIGYKKARLEEDEAKRVFYVAPTRARDHLIRTCTGLTERLCGLTTLQPGLEMANIAVSPIPYDTLDAQPPCCPPPYQRIPRAYSWIL